MTSTSAPAPDPAHDVFSARELADAAGVPVGVIRRLVAAAEIPTLDGEFVGYDGAVAAVEALRSGRLASRADGLPPGIFGGALYTLSVTAAANVRARGVSALVSTGVHAGAILIVAFVTTATLTTASSDIELHPPTELTRVIFVADPGPGGGGGGGGLRMPTPTQAQREGTSAVSSPAPDRIEPRAIEPVETPSEPPRLDHESLPPIFAPLAAARADQTDLRGLLSDTPDAEAASHGPGVEGGVGNGAGLGIGGGSGRGVGDGSGGGTGGGPYRPGSGIAAPRLLHEERPVYTEDARRRGIEGDVLIELVVRSDGTVGNVRLVHRLEYGLDEQALNAVRRWRFAPATRFGEPVDVMVEVAVEFRLR